MLPGLKNHDQMTKGVVELGGFRQEVTIEGC